MSENQNNSHSLLENPVITEYIKQIEALNCDYEIIKFETRKLTLKNVNPKLADEFEILSKKGRYHYEVIYNVFMAHGDKAKEIIEYAIKKELSPLGLVCYSESVKRKEMDALSEKVKFDTEIKNSNIMKLPKKLRRGWK